MKFVLRVVDKFCFLFISVGVGVRRFGGMGRWWFLARRGENFRVLFLGSVIFSFVVVLFFICFLGCFGYLGRVFCEV